MKSSGKFRKKPVVIEAWRYDDPSAELTTVTPRWLIEGLLKPRTEEGAMWQADVDGEEKLCIYTLEGVLTASIGDYIIKGVQGEVYPCKPEIFEATYEEVEND